MTMRRTLSGINHLDKSTSSLLFLVDYVKLACWCIQEDEVHRPSLGQVVQILEGVIDVEVPPIPQYLCFLDDNEENVNFFTDLVSR